MYRRDFLKMGTFAAIGSGLAGCVPMTSSRQPFFAAHNLPIGIQLYTLGPDLDDDFGGTLNGVAAIGYRTVEIASLHGRTAQQFRAALDTAGLACRCVHAPGEPLGPGPNLSGDLAALAADVRRLGARDIVMPNPLSPKIFTPPAGADPFTVIRAATAALTLDDYKRMAAFLNEKARVLESHGVRLGYHNHNVEFAPKGDSTGFDILLAETDPALVTFEFDVGWAAAAGVDSVALLEAHPQRFTKMHVKDIQPSTRTNFSLQQDPIEVGRGQVDWKTILPAAYAAGVRDYFVEQEPPFPGKRIDSVAASYRYLASLSTR